MTSDRIYHLAVAGILTAADLQNSHDELHFVHPKTKLTALAAAVWNGHKHTVKLLLDYGADPDGTPGSRPPLWVAAGKTRRNANSIIDILLRHYANASRPSSFDDNSTPLLRAMLTLKSPAILRALVKAGARPAVQNNKGESAENVATRRNDHQRAAALFSKPSPVNDRLERFGAFLSAIVLVVACRHEQPMIALAAAATLIMIKASAIREYLLLNGLIETVQTTELKQELTEDIHRFLHQKQLSRFFCTDGSFVKTVIEHAVALDSDPENTLDVKDLMRLALYQTVLYCESSSQMQQSKHFDAIVHHIARIATFVSPEDGSATRIGKGSKENLNPFIRDCLESQAMKGPILLVVISEEAWIGEASADALQGHNLDMQGVHFHEIIIDDTARSIMQTDQPGLEKYLLSLLIAPLNETATEK
ncbi:hypothetical protein ASPWEDRAFT_538408 [Aspergillus wentii DTO 134E9]|uniref:Uncharacterized protein n=1 Tax=Aspergillus wentii DTO 134E9 TaxID=1073089 RepID=A0A1L9RN47_ASPWE|nr:uncharacterized protein ASPWEDRAFT_538408 [Aspergillus wentii DTO 134E9]OJJ36257.1 hypothetical protein ASPWEDRAFT_538408 [Aspergillus wentii DTO 134E9]